MAVKKSDPKTRSSPLPYIAVRQPSLQSWSGPRTPRALAENLVRTFGLDPSITTLSARPGGTRTPPPTCCNLP